MDMKHTGGRNELIACVWLLNEGYEVFRNVSQHGLIDVVAMKDGKIFYFDVKAAGGGKAEFGKKLTQVQIDAGVRPLYVKKDGSCHIDWLTGSIEKAREDRQCKLCSEKFKPWNDWQVFCSNSCRMKNFKAEKVGHMAQETAENKEAGLRPTCPQPLDIWKNGGPLGSATKGA